MQRAILTAIGLGLVSAVVFASAAARPNALGVALYLVTMLPLFLAGLGWGWRMGVIAALASSAALALIGGPATAASFAVSQAAPATLLSYLALLQRDVTRPDGTQGTEWYPIGRLVLWTVFFAGVLTPLVFLLLGGDIDTVKSQLRDGMKASIEQSLPKVDGKPPLSGTDIDQLAKAFVDLLPAGLAVSVVSSLLFNLWLAARITWASGQLERPWPALDETALPRGTPLLLLAALVTMNLGGFPAISGLAFSGGLFIAFVLIGLAVVHHLTRGKAWRPFALAALYLGVLFLVIPGTPIPLVLLIALLGIADTVADLRRLNRGGTGPPPLTPSTST
ncbi:MAG: DUF2232 domain-containing protein [Hyphomicrobium sp.]|nr:DUF2232 domain-containing protein [Hyphomicrobium sp.]